MAPEIIKQTTYDNKADIWSLGILLYELLHGKVPFDGSNLSEKCNNILNYQNIKFDYHISDKSKDLISKILKKHPHERIDFNGIFTHSWVMTFEKILNVNVKSYIYEKTEKKHLANIQTSFVDSPLLGNQQNNKGFDLQTIKTIKNNKKITDDSFFASQNQIPQEIERESFCLNSHYINFFFQRYGSKRFAKIR